MIKDTFVHPDLSFTDIIYSYDSRKFLQLLESGVDIIKVQKFLGHASIQNTLIYLKYSNKDFEKAIINANKNIGLL